MTRTKLLLLDVNGTFNQCKSNPKSFINDPFDQEIIPAAAAAIARYAADGWVIQGVSNQGGVHYGHKSLYACIEEMDYTLQLVPQLRSIYFCPDLGDTCYAVYRPWLGFLRWGNVRRFNGGMGDNHRYALGGFRKPQPGMLILAVNRFLESLAMKQLLEGVEVLMVGDRPEDKGAAIAAAGWLAERESKVTLNFLDAEAWRGEDF
jgi:histidinol phosphatase-like enzyme